MFSGRHSERFPIRFDVDGRNQQAGLSQAMPLQDGSECAMSGRGASLRRGPSAANREAVSLRGGCGARRHCPLRSAPGQRRHARRGLHPVGAAPRHHWILTHYANTGAAFVPITLDAAAHAGNFRPGDLILLVASAAAWPPDWRWWSGDGTISAPHTARSADRRQNLEETAGDVARPTQEPGSSRRRAPGKGPRFTSASHPPPIRPSTATGPLPPTSAQKKPSVLLDDSIIKSI